MPTTFTIPTTAIIEMSLRMNIFEQTILLIRHYLFDPSAISPISDGVTALNELISSWDSGIGGITTTMSTYQTTDVTYSQIRAQMIYPTRYSYQSTLPTVSNGVQAPPTMPQNSSIVVTLQSIVAGRKGRGNVFYTGLEATAIAGGLVSPIDRAHALVMATQLTQPIATTTEPEQFFPIIYNRATPSTSPLITHATSQPQARVMRRRTVGHGI